MASQLLIYTLKNTGGSAGCVRSGKGGKLQSSQEGINDSAAPSAAQSLIYKKYLFIHTIYFLGFCTWFLLILFFPTTFKRHLDKRSLQFCKLNLIISQKRAKQQETATEAEFTSRAQSESLGGWPKTGQRTVDSDDGHV